MGIGNKGNPAHPLAADISKQRAKQKAGIIAIIVLSSVFAVILFSGAAWCIIFKLRYGSHPPGHSPSSLTKASGTITLISILVPNSYSVLVTALKFVLSYYVPLWSELPWKKKIIMSNALEIFGAQSSIFSEVPVLTFEHLREMKYKAK